VKRMIVDREGMTTEFLTRLHAERECRHDLTDQSVSGSLLFTLENESVCAIMGGEETAHKA
jgi:hypothetical protein